MAQECISINPCEPKKEEFSLWGVAYHAQVEDKHYSGTALVLARDANHARQLFMTQSAFNGTPEAIVIESTAQVPTLTESGLCIESYTDGVARRINYGF